MRRKRYQTHEDVRVEAQRRALAGMHPAVAAAAAAQQGYQGGPVVASGPSAELQRVSGELPEQQANRGAMAAGGAAGAGQRPYYGRLDPTQVAGSMGGSAADLGVALNRQEGNPRGGQAYRRFIGADELEHHVYAGGRDIAMKPRNTGAQALELKLADAARRMGQDAPPGPADATGQPDLAAVHALPLEQQEALMVLASAAAAQAQQNAAHPELSIMPRRRRAR